MKSPLALTCALLFVLGLLVAPEAPAATTLPPALTARCGVLFTLQAQENYGGWINTMPNNFGGAEWTHQLFLGYLPFVLVENHSNTTLLLQGAIAGNPASVAFYQPPLSIRCKRIGTSLSGYITIEPMPLTAIYVFQSYADPNAVKVYGMKIYGAGSGDGTGSGSPQVGPGQTVMITPWLPPSEVLADTGHFFDWRNDLTTSFVATPGFRGPQHSFCCSWLTGPTTYVNGSINGPMSAIGVIGTRLADAWDLEISPSSASMASQVRIFLATTLPADWTNCFPESARIATYPFRLSDHMAPLVASTVNSLRGVTLQNRVVQPFLLAEVPLQSATMKAIAPASADADLDGMDDAWEQSVFGGGGGDPEADPDRDGFSNRFEFLAGSSPTDGSDHIRTSLSPQSATKFSLRWSSVPGRSYQIEASSNLGDWTTVATVTGAATPASEATSLVSANGANRYFRVRILSPFP